MKWFCVSLISLSLFLSVAEAEDSGLIVVGYLPHYRLVGIEADRLTGITDLVYFGIEPTSDGTFPNTISKVQLTQLAELKDTVECRLLLTVGGWERSADFPALTLNATAQTRFVGELLKFCQKNQFDGVDFDWEHPSGPAEIQRYAQLITETKRQFVRNNLLVTVALASWQDLGAAAYRDVDRIHLMAYDHDFPQATLQKSREDVERLIRQGCPASKIVLGMPFYGRNKAKQARTYAELVQTNDFDPQSDVTEGFALNGKSTVTAKIEMAMRRKLAGVMIWEVGQDAVGNEASLLHHIGKTLSLSNAPEK